MLNIEIIKEFATSLPFTSIDFPFDNVTMTVKVKGKIFLFLPLDVFPFKFSFKVTPENNIELKEKYDFITDAFHLNKKHWATFDSQYKDLNSISEINIAKSLIYDSFVLVVNKLKVSEKYEIFEVLKQTPLDFRKVENY